MADPGENTPCQPTNFVSLFSFATAALLVRILSSVGTISFTCDFTLLSAFDGRLLEPVCALRRAARDTLHLDACENLLPPIHPD